MRTATTLALAATFALLAPAIAAAKQQQPTPWDSVAAAVDELEGAARTVHREARRDQELGGWGAGSALEELAELQAAARRFHREIERRHQNPDRMDGAYNALEWAYFRAARELYVAHPFGGVEREFERVGLVIRDLAVDYEGALLVSYDIELDLGLDLEPVARQASRTRTGSELDSNTRP